MTGCCSASRRRSSRPRSAQQRRPSAGAGTDQQGKPGSSASSTPPSRASWREQWLADAQDYCARLQRQVQEWSRTSERADALQVGLQLLGEQAGSHQQAWEQALRLSSRSPRRCSRSNPSSSNTANSARPVRRQVRAQVAAALQAQADQADRLPGMRSRRCSRRASSRCAGSRRNARPACAWRSSKTRTAAGRLSCSAGWTSSTPPGRFQPR